MSKAELLAAASAFRNTSPGVRAAIEKLTPALLTKDEADDIEGDWLVSEVQLAKMEASNTDKPMRRAHEYIRRLLCDRAALVQALEAKR